MSYLTATLYVNKLYQEQWPKIVLGEDGSLIDNMIGGVKNRFNRLFDTSKNSLVMNFLSFLGPGFLIGLGFPWFGVAYEVADALGFDWPGLWNSLKDSLLKIFSPSSSGEKPTREELHTQLEESTGEALQKNVKENVDEEKLEKIRQKTGGDQQMPAHTGMTSTKKLIKKAGLIGSALRSRGLLMRLFKKLIPWAVTTLAVSLGLAVVGSGVAGALGVGPDSKKEGPGEGGETASKTRDPIHSLQMAPNPDPDLFEFNKNDTGSIWLENGDINNIQNILLSWIFAIYPSLKQKQPEIVSSKAFIEVENRFRKGNEGAQNLQTYAIPRPFQRKSEVVSYIVNEYLKNKPA